MQDSIIKKDYAIGPKILTTEGGFIMSNKIKSVNETATKESLLIGLKENVKSLLRKKDETFYDLGESLNIIKALTAHNEFSKFIKDEIDFSHNLANKYMRIASNYSKEEALALGVRKATSLLSLDKETRTKFLKENDVPNIKCDKLDDMLKELKGGKKSQDEKAKARSFVKNIDKFKKDLSNKIGLFSKYKYEMDDLLMEEDKEILDKLEELNNLINAKSVNIDESIQEEVTTTSYDIIDDSVESDSDYDSVYDESFVFNFN